MTDRKLLTRTELWAAIVPPNAIFPVPYGPGNDPTLVASLLRLNPPELRAGYLAGLDEPLRTATARLLAENGVEVPSARTTPEETTVSAPVRQYLRLHRHAAPAENPVVLGPFKAVAVTCHRVLVETEDGETTALGLIHGMGGGWGVDGGFAVSNPHLVAVPDGDGVVPYAQDGPKDQEFTRFLHFEVCVSAADTPVPPVRPAAPAGSPKVPADLARRVREAWQRGDVKGLRYAILGIGLDRLGEAEVKTLTDQHLRVLLTEESPPRVKRLTAPECVGDLYLTEKDVHGAYRTPPEKMINWMVAAADHLAARVGPGERAALRIDLQVRAWEYRIKAWVHVVPVQERS